MSYKRHTKDTMKNLIHRIILRLSTEDHDQLKLTATENNTTVSKYVRKIIQDAIWGEL